MSQTCEDEIMRRFQNRIFVKRTDVFLEVYPVFSDGGQSAGVYDGTGGIAVVLSIRC